MKQQIKTNEKKKKKNGKVKKVLLLLLLLVIILGLAFWDKVRQNGGGLSGMIAATLGHDEDTLKNLPKMYCLILGKSQNLTDTIMLASYDPKTGKAALLSIPRDTFVGDNKDTATAWDKINAVYQTGVENVLEDVSNLTGINVEYYLMVDTEALKLLVDEIGGVEFDVPIDMKYDDGKQNLHINLKAGKQILDGDKAEQVVRFRHNNDGSTYPEEYGIEDVGRMRTQRAFLTALAKQTLVPSNITKIPSFLDIAEQYVKTNLNFDAIKDYIPYAVNFNVDNLKTDKLPGVAEVANGIWVYSVYEDEAEKVIDELFFSSLKEQDEIQDIEDEDTKTILNEEPANDVFINKVEEPIVYEEDRADVNIEVLDGTGLSTNLSEAVTKLEKAGYTVSKTGKTNITSKTVIINRTGVSTEIEKDVEDILKTGEILAGEKNEKTDITIILGSDYIM